MNNIAAVTASSRPRAAAAAGFSILELIVAMGLFTVVIGVTLSGLSNVMNGNELVITVAATNNSARTGMDLMVRDFLQVGSGLPASHTVSIPNGTGAVPVRLPGPPGVAAFETSAGDAVLPALITHAGAGPTIRGISTDVVSMLMADNAFLDIDLTAVSASTVTVVVGPDLGAGPDRVVPGQLMLISKGSVNALVQVTSVDPVTRVLTFADNDSLRLNQSTAANGTLPALNAQDPVDDASATRISRVRMITYYLENADPLHPRLMRRINNGSAETFDNTLGTAVALDVVDLEFTYDISNGSGNPGNVEMTANDLTVNGRCSPAACAETQIRKVNVWLTSHAPSRKFDFLSNTLNSQVSLRAMAFVDRYR